MMRWLACRLLGHTLPMVSRGCLVCERCGRELARSESYTD